MTAGRCTGIRIQSIDLERIHQVEFLVSGCEEDDPFVEALPVWPEPPIELDVGTQVLIVEAAVVGLTCKYANPLLRW